MTPEPGVSVILPVYNGETFLRAAMASVLGQSYSHWELLVVDDGSTDASASICDEFAQTDSRIKVFHQTNGGVNAARAKGADHATGEYLVFLDADDQLVPDALAYLIGNFLPGTDLLLAEGRDETLLEKESYLAELWAGRIGPALWGKMFRTALYKQMDYRALDRRLAMGEDLLMNSIYALNIRQARLLPRQVYVVNHDNENSVTRTFKHNWEYEKYYFSKVEELFLRECSDLPSFEHLRLLVNKSWLNAMKYVILDGGEINYEDSPFKAVQDYFRKRPRDLGPSERLLFSVRNPRLYRLIMHASIQWRRRKK